MIYFRLKAVAEKKKNRKNQQFSNGTSTRSFYIERAQYFNGANNFIFLQFLVSFHCHFIW